MKKICCEDECDDTYKRIFIQQVLILKQLKEICIPEKHCVQSYALDQYESSKSKLNGIIKVDQKAIKFDDLLGRSFNAIVSLEKCIKDITEIKADEGKLFVSVIYIFGLIMDTNLKENMCVHMLENVCLSNLKRLCDLL